MRRGGQRPPLGEEKKKRIISLYLENQALTVKAVGELAGCATSTAWNVLVAEGIEIRGGSKWLNEKAHSQRILRRWDGGKTTIAIARLYKLNREGIARVVAANRPYDNRMRKMLNAVFGPQADTIRFLKSISSTRNAGRCTICGQANKTLVKDYCHSSGRFRNLLCRSCNQGLGCFDDNAARMIRASAYLKKHAPIVTERQTRRGHRRALNSRYTTPLASR